MGGSSVESQLSNSSVGYLLQACSVVSEESRSSSSRPRGGDQNMGDESPTKMRKVGEPSIADLYALMAETHTISKETRDKFEPRLEAIESMVSSHGEKFGEVERNWCHKTTS